MLTDLFLRGDEEDAAEVMHGFYSLYFGPRAGAEPERRAYWNRLWQIYLGTGDCKAYVFGRQGIDQRNVTEL